MRKRSQQRVVLDSNVLISALATPHGVSGQILDAWEDNRFTLIISEYILNEVKTILEEKFNLNRDFVAQKMVPLYQIAEIVEPLAVRDANIHENDFPILGTALSGVSSVLVTGDHELLKMKRYHRIHILSPRTFLDIDILS